MMKERESILVTGGAGFIGSHLCETLTGYGREVICVDNMNGFYDPHIKEQNISALINRPGFTFVKGDIRDRDQMTRVMKSFNPGTVIHLAAMAGVRSSLEDPALYFDVNLMGTVTLLECMRSEGIKRMIFASSSSVYGGNSKVPFSESDPVTCQLSPYACSKIAGELLCHNYHWLYGFDIFCLRFFTVFGPRQRPDLAIHKFTSLMLEGSPVPVFGDGTSSRDYTYISDAVRAICSSAERLKGFEIYNIGDSNPVMLDTMISTIEEALGIKAVREYLPLQPGDPMTTYADIHKAMNELDYRPDYDFATGIGEFVTWKLGSEAGQAG